MAKNKKTNSMRLLDQCGANYTMHEYNSSDGKIDGVSVAEKIDQACDLVFKTLVAQGSSKTYYVFIIPVTSELNLKKAAQACGEKKIEMIGVKDITKITGYVRGGCSPIGMKKLFKTYLDQSAIDKVYIIYSGGKIGIQIQSSPGDLLDVVKGEFAQLT